MSEQITIPERHLSVEEFLAWAEPQPHGRFELLNGRVFAMAPERAVHFLTKYAAVKALERAIGAAGIPCQALPDGATVRVAADTAFEPDASVNCGAPMADDDMVAPNPVVVVEVVSPNSRRIDTGRKLTAYFRVPSIQHYLLLVTDQRAVVHHARAGSDIATRIIHAGAIALDPPGITIQVEDLFPPA
jgi:Uma2 family endonuclease